MRIYRVSKYTNMDEHDGYEFYTNKKEAEKMQRKYNQESKDDDDEFESNENSNMEGGGWGVVLPIDFTLTKSGIIDLLMQYASHNDNG